MSRISRNLLLNRLRDRLELLDESILLIQELVMDLAQESLPDAELHRLLELDDQAFAEEIYGYVSVMASQALTAILQDDAVLDAGTSELTEILSRVMILSSQGNTQEAIDLLESYIGLLPDDYDRPDALREKIGALADSTAPAEYLMLMTALSSCHGIEGHYTKPLALWEADIGIEPNDYLDPKRVLSKIHKRAERVGPEPFANFAGMPGTPYAVLLPQGNVAADPFLMYLMMSIAALAISRRHGMAVDLFEAWLDLMPEDYDDLKKLRVKLGARLEEANQDLRLGLVATLGDSFEIVGRKSEAMKIKMAALGFDDLSLETDESLRKKVRAHLENTRPESAAYFIASLAIWLETQGHGEAALSILEELIGLEKKDYLDPGKLADKLSRWLTQTLIIEVSYFAVTCLAGMLNMQERSSQALAILETSLGLKKTDYPNLKDLSSKLRRWRENLAPDLQATHIRMLIDVLSSLNRTADMIAVIVADVDLPLTDFLNRERLAERMRPKLDILGNDTSPSYLLSLVYALDSAGYVHEASAVVDWYLNDYVNINSHYETGIAAITARCPLLHRWFEHLGADNRDRALKMCHDAVRYLRFGLDEIGVRLEDRIAFINYVSTVRRHILRTGYHWATLEPDEDRARAIHLDVQLWDAELSQRMLFEKFLLWRISTCDKSAEAPTTGWPFVEQKELPLLHHLPKLNPQDWLVSSALARPFAFEAGKEQAPSARPVTYPAQEQETPRWFTQAKEIVRSGETRKLLTRAFGNDFLLLRASFLDDGSIVWAALSGKGEDLRVDRFDKTAPLALQKIRFATARHDLQMCLTWWHHSGSLALSTFVDDVMPLLEDVARLLDQLVPQISTAGESAATTLSEFPLKFQELFNGWNQKFPAPLAQAAQGMSRNDVLNIICTPLIQLPAEAGQYAEWLGYARAYWREIADLILQSEDADLEGPGLRLALDAATQLYVETVSNIWRLDSLAPLLTEEVDVVLQLDDVLHGVPVAHLLIEGMPLYQRVHSLRTSLNILLAMLQRSIETEDQRPYESSAEHMLVLSGLGADQQQAAFYLHAGHKSLAKDYALNYYGAADHPKASSGSVRRALEDAGSLSLLTVCGHGSRYEAGVWLHDELWKGGGCDLSRVAWLLMISCSIGRLEQTGDLDVEGFCVELVLNRSRSTLACRWPVYGLEAVSFANEVVYQYLKLLKDTKSGPRTERGCLRAQALNVARQVFLNAPPEQDMTKYAGLNTIGAFELYGMG